MFRYLTICTVLLGLFPCMLIAQNLTILPLETDNTFFSIDQLWQVSVLNPKTSPVESVFELRLEDKSHNTVLTAVSKPLTWRSGMTTLTPSVRSSIPVIYAKSALAQTLRETGRLSFGTYILCYRCLDAKDQTVLGVACRERTVLPMLPPELISPANGENVETLQPLLLWRGPMPLQQNGVSYALRLVEKPTDKTDAFSALRMRAPLVNAMVKTTYLPYPITAKPLEDGKTYAWQVEAKAGDLSLGATEAWTFTVKLPKIVPIVRPEQSYCWVKEVEDGRYCSPTDSLKFMYDNLEGETTLTYSLTNTATKTLEKSLPTISLSAGTNALVLPFETLKSIAPKVLYRLEIVNSKGRHYFLPFIPQ